jgi:CDP-glycerol glycerophosphotransferase (TagB/SpsB family)
MKINKKKPGHWLLLLQQGLYALLASCARPVRPRHGKPVVVLYGHQLSGNLEALYQSWRNDNTQHLTFYFLSLDPKQSRQLKEQAINVLQCNKIVDMLVLCRASTIICDHGLHLLEPLVYLSNIKFIDVWHGIPFKGFDSADFRLQHCFDETWVTSPLLRKIYIDKFGFNPNRTLSLGYARTDKLFNKTVPQYNFRKLASIPQEDKIILYAPTWKQDEKGRQLFPFGESEKAFISALNTICEKQQAKLIIRSHLNASIDEDHFSNVIYCPQKTYTNTEDLLLISDILVCDWSSIAFDFLATDRPTIFLDVPPPFSKGFSLGQEYRFGKIVSTIDEFTQSLSQYLAAPDCYQKEYGDISQKVKNDVYGDNQDGRSAERQLNQLRNISGPKS